MLTGRPYDDSRPQPLKIPLTQGYVALVDPQDYGLVSAFKWQANVQRRKNRVTVYATRRVWKSGKQETISMHGFIVGYPRPDHMDGDGLNNQRNNLRPATRSQNMANSRTIQGSSVFKGVSRNKRSGRWAAYIKIDRIKRHIGMFGSEIDAATAYNLIAYELFGDFCRLNVPAESQL